MSKPPKEQTGLTRPIDPATLDRFIQLQEKEIGVRQQELGLRAQELAQQGKKDENAHKYAEKALEAELTDRKDQRSHSITISKHLITFGIIAIIFLAALIGYALKLGKDQFIIEAIKILGSFLAGLASGYGIKASQKSKKDDSKAP